MKKLSILLFLSIYGLTTLYAQHLGFVESECGVVPSPEYYYQNNNYGSHGSGYQLYHNGVIILADQLDMGQCEGTFLDFVNDSTGFFY